MTFVDAIKSGFKNCFKYSGRASRSEYWYFYLFGILVNFPIKLLEQVDHELVLILLIVVTILIVVPTISLQVRRYHDAGLSGKWFLLLILIGLGVWGVYFWFAEGASADSPASDFYPIVGITSIICLLANFIISCRRSDPGDNKYGPNPLLAVGEELEEVYQENKTEAVNDKQPEQPTEVASKENEVYPAESEPSEPKAKTDTEATLAEIEDMYKRSVITKTERDKLRKKALGLD